MVGVAVGGGSVVVFGDLGSLPAASLGTATLPSARSF